MSDILPLPTGTHTIDINGVITANPLVPPFADEKIENILKAQKAYEPDLDVDAEKAKINNSIFFSKVLHIPQDEAYRHVDDILKSWTGDNHANHQTFWGDLKNAWRRGVLSRQKALLWYEKWARDLTGEQEQQIDEKIKEIEREMRQIPGNKYKWNQPLGWVENATEMFGQQYVNFLKGGIVGGLAGIAVGALTANPALAMAAMGVGTGAVTLSDIFKMELGGEYERLSNLKDKNGKPIPDYLKKLGALTVGIANTALESFQLKWLAGSVVGKSLESSVMQAVLRTLRSNKYRSLIMRFLGRQALFTTEQTAQETLQNLTNIIIDNAAKLVANKFNNTDFQLDGKAAISELMATMRQSLGVFFVTGLPGHSIRALKESFAVDSPRGTLTEAEVESKPEVTTINDEVSTTETGQFSEPKDVILVKPKKTDHEIYEEYQQEAQNFKGSSSAKTPIEESYDRYKKVFFYKRDTRLYENDVYAKKMTDRINKIIDSIGLPKGVTKEDMKLALLVAIDAKSKEADLELYRPQVGEYERKIIDIARDLPSEFDEIVDELKSKADEISQAAVDAEIVQNALDNWFPRFWDVKKKENITNKDYNPFITFTPHLKQRKFSTIVEGWAKGYKLRITDPVQALHTMRRTLIQIIENKNFLNALAHLRDENGEKLLSTRYKEGYKKVKIPNFEVWTYVDTVSLAELMNDMRDLNKVKETVKPTIGASKLDKLATIVKNALVARGFTENEAISAINKIRQAKGDEVENVVKDVATEAMEREQITFKPIYDRDVIVTDKGAVLKKTEVYAPARVADNLNNIFGVSALKQIPGTAGKIIQALDKAQNMLKHNILFTSLFHAQAFLRSFLLGGNIDLNDVNLVASYKAGQDMILSMHPAVKTLIGNGLTLGLKQEWDAELLKQRTKLGELVDKIAPIAEIKKTLMGMRDAYESWLFEGLGANLKIMAAVRELSKLMKEYPDKNINELAEIVANEMNDDFGGLHLQRIGRNPTLQHIFKIFALAPDWTESNLRTVFKAFKKGVEGEVYRRFWMRIAIRGLGLTLLGNFAMAGGDVKEMARRYELAVKSGNIAKILSVDITPIFRLLGDEGMHEYYYSILGHFVDPLRAVFNPFRFMHAKGGVFYRTFQEMVTGEDWAGRGFNTLNDLLEEGATVSFRAKTGVIDYSRFPAFVIHSLIGWQPIPLQNMVGFVMGEQEQLEAFLNSLGFGIRKTPLEVENVNIFQY